MTIKRTISGNLAGIKALELRCSCGAFVSIPVTSPLQDRVVCPGCSKPILEADTKQAKNVSIHKMMSGLAEWQNSSSRCEVTFTLDAEALNPLSAYLVSSPLELELPSGRKVSVARCFHEFKLWEGKPIGYTYGGKAVLDSNGEPLFAELAILRLLQRKGWQGVWVDNFRKRYRQSWPDHCDLPPDARSLLEKANGGRQWPAGCWDVFARGNDEYLFVEAKRRGKDKITRPGKQWLETALDSGVPLGNFLMFEWGISDATP